MCEAAGGLLVSIQGRPPAVRACQTHTYHWTGRMCTSVIRGVRGNRRQQDLASTLCLVSACWGKIPPAAGWGVNVYRCNHAWTRACSTVQERARYLPQLLMTILFVPAPLHALPVLEAPLNLRLRCCLCTHVDFTLGENEGASGTVEIARRRSPVIAALPVMK